MSARAEAYVERVLGTHDALRPSDRRVLRALARLHNGDGDRVQVRVAELCEAAAISHKTYRKSLKRLAGFGLVVRHAAYWPEDMGAGPDARRENEFEIVGLPNA